MCRSNLIYSFFRTSNLFENFEKLDFYKRIKFIDSPQVFVRFRREMSQQKLVFTDTFLYQTSRCRHDRNEKETQTEIYINIHRSCQSILQFDPKLLKITEICELCIQLSFEIELKLINTNLNLNLVPKLCSEKGFLLIYWNKQESRCGF